MKTVRYISLEALAATLKLPQKFLRELVAKQQIPYLNVNGRLRFNIVAVEQTLDELAKRGNCDE